MFIKLESHFTQNVPGGVSVGTISSAIRLGNGTENEYSRVS